MWIHLYYGSTHLYYYITCIHLYYYITCIHVRRSIRSILLVYMYVDLYSYITCIHGCRSIQGEALDQRIATFWNPKVVILGFHILLLEYIKTFMLQYAFECMVHMLQYVFEFVTCIHVCRSTHGQTLDQQITTM